MLEPTKKQFFDPAVSALAGKRPDSASLVLVQTLVFQLSVAIRLSVAGDGSAGDNGMLILSGINFVVETHPCYHHCCGYQDDNVGTD